MPPVLPTSTSTAGPTFTWPNDFVSNDLCYINNKDGTFTNRLDEYFKHTGWNAMGTDAVDINNDGYTDLISLEMLPENQYA
jgi:hypothetical protein